MLIVTKTSMVSVHIVQVIHDCRAIAGCLSVQFGVKLANVFDTQVNVRHFPRVIFPRVCYS